MEKLISLASYHKKRDFKKTPEPKGKIAKGEHNFFCIQKHAASHLHYDFRLELNGVLKSWAVPKGPCFDSKIKRLAIQVEDHPLDYGMFEGIIPPGQYGAGKVLLWDKGSWELLKDKGSKKDMGEHLRFRLAGKKLKGRWDLIHFKENSWFLVKYQDEYALPLENYDITKEEPLSVLSHKPIEELSLEKQKKKISKPKLPQSNFPERLSVELCKRADSPPLGNNWIHELKFDGYRILAYKDHSKVRLISRNFKDWTAKFPNIVNNIKSLAIDRAIFDGEIVLEDENSRSNFQLLQNSITEGEKANFSYHIFDLLYLDNFDLRSLSLLERKSYLSSIIDTNSEVLRFSEHIIGSGDKVFKEACKAKLEGIVSKDSQSKYQGGRSSSWLKVKCLNRQEFVVGGFTNPKNSRSYFGSLYLGFYDKKSRLQYAGKVGTGFSDQSLKNLYAELTKLSSDKSPFATLPPDVKAANFVKPKIIVEIEFSEWTKDGRLRHPSFKGLRMDKKAKTISKEEASSEKILKNPKKILYEEDKISKQQIYDYYLKNSALILPYIKDRPLTLLRCPASYKDCFYQKHLRSKTAGIYSIETESNKALNLYIRDFQGLESLVQMAVLEIHCWGSAIFNLEKPDFIVFDLDPALDLAWESLVKAAFEIKKELEALKLRAFLKSSGGKGLHLVIPIVPEYSWQEVKNYTKVFVEYLEKKYPTNYTSKISKKLRKSKIFVDYLRNQKEATAISPYSLRARTHAPIAVPLDWEELEGAKKNLLFTLNTIDKRLDKLKEDPWKDFFKIKQFLKM